MIGGGRLFRRSAAAASILAITSLAAAGGCAKIIGADGYTEAAEALCACPELAEISDCTTLTRKRLSLAKAPDRAAWLDRYAAECSDGCGPSAAACFDRDPVCTPPGEACFSSEECCGYTQGGGCCPDAVDPTSSQCCVHCLTCGEVLDEVMSPDPLCADARQLLFDAVDCLCDVCANVCPQNCPSGPFANLTPACAVCFDASTRVGGACYDEILVCAADVPYAP